MTIKGFVLLSGGLDSSTCLGVACDKLLNHNVTAISIHYGQRHQKEIEAAKNVADYFGVKHETHSIVGMPKSMLTSPEAPIPNCSYSDITGVSPTYVPFRNGQLLSKIAGIASSRLDDEGDRAIIYVGTHAEDAANDAYPDCRLDFIGAMAAAIYIGTYHKVRLSAPLIEMSKDEVVTLGKKLGVPLEITWSCYAGEELHCGTCPTCRARRSAFERAGVMDLTWYATPTEPTY
jgi:7-cyano-7-deazaguanine synthase